MSNHISQMDPPVLGRRGAAAERATTWPRPSSSASRCCGRVIYRLGAFPVERGGADRRALRIAREVLGRGDVLLMFPEGTRYTDGRLRPGLPGAGSLALEPGVTVVPGGDLGQPPAARPGAGGLRRRRVDLSDLDGGAAQQRAPVAADRMMAAIAALIPAAGGPPHRAAPGHVDG